MGDTGGQGQGQGQDLHGGQGQGQGQGQPMWTPYGFIPFNMGGQVELITLHDIAVHVNEVVKAKI